MMAKELKTLQDFIKKLRGDTEGNWIGEWPKKITVDNALCYIQEFEKGLKEEAIKSIKAYQKNYPDMDATKVDPKGFKNGVFEIVTDIPGGTHNLAEVRAFISVVGWIKWFFGITNEDLK